MWFSLLLLIEKIYCYSCLLLMYCSVHCSVKQSWGPTGCDAMWLAVWGARSRTRRPGACGSSCRWGSVGHHKGSQCSDQVQSMFAERVMHVWTVLETREWRPALPSHSACLTCRICRRLHPRCLLQLQRVQLCLDLWLQMKLDKKGIILVQNSRNSNLWIQTNERIGGTADRFTQKTVSVP